MADEEGLKMRCGACWFQSSEGCCGYLLFKRWFLLARSLVALTSLCLKVRRRYISIERLFYISSLVACCADVNI